jgi:hypothetical protein
VTPSKNTCTIVVGRLLEIRVIDGYRSPDDVDAMIRMIGESVVRLPPGTKFFIAADWRDATIMDPETATRVQAMLTTINPRIARSGILTLPEHPTTNLQLVRLIREAQNANRRHFTSASAMYQWLAEELTPDEAKRLRVFLGL